VDQVDLRQLESRTVRWPVGWIVAFVLALSGVWVTVTFGPEIGIWWQGVSSTMTTPEVFREWVESLGAWGPAAFFLAQTLQVILAPIPGALFPPVGSLAFGPWPALGLSLAGMALGSAVVFLVARRWGRPLAVRLVGEDLIHRYQNVMTARGGLLIWVVFLLPLLPDDALCALAGLSGIRFRRFMVIATVGRVPAVATGVFAMAGLEGSPPWIWVLATTVGALAVWAGFRYRETVERHLLGILGRRDHPEVRVPVPALAGGTASSQPERLRAPDAEQGGEEVKSRDPLGPVMAVVVATTFIAVVVGVVTGVSGLASGIILFWGSALAVMVGWARGAD
jgi:uncharacterized membrane protein YdjX (TVP38/TMEM64 family)